MKKSKRFISLLLSVVMLMSVINTGLVAFATDATSYTLSADEAEKLPDAGAVATSTQIIRVASGLGSFQVGSTIVPATPSGIPSISGDNVYANAGEVNEEASYPEVKITFNEVPESVPVITCVNSNTNAGNVNFLQAVVSEDGKTYTWQIAGGTANAGDTLKFKISYKFNGMDYVSSAYSYVENVSQPAGSYVSTKSKYVPSTWADWFGGEDTVQASVSAATRVLGINTYGNLESFTTSSSDTRGYYDAGSNVFATNANTLYSTYSITRSNEDNTIHYLNDRRSYADVYVDTSVTSSFADLNLRYAVAMVQADADNSMQELGAIAIKDGGNEVNDDLSGTADSKLGFKASTGSMNPGDQFVSLFNGTTLTEGEYTVVSKITSSYGNALNTTIFPVGLRVHTVDKGELRTLINDILHNYTPESPLTTAQYKGVNPQSWYYESGFDAYEAAMLNAQTVLQNPRVTQDDITNAITSLTEAYDGLVLKEADYTALDEAIAEAEGYNEAEYSLETYAKLKEAISEDVIQRGYSVLYQPQVDLWEAAVYEAIDGLKYTLADYTELDELYAEAQEKATHKDDYNNFYLVEDVLETLVWDIEAPEQWRVDQMAEELREALDSLTYVGADYSEVEKAMEEARTYSASNYTNDSYENLRSVLNSIDYTLDKSQQETVDNYVTLINEAIDNLVELTADYVAFEALLEQIDELVEEYYTTDSYNAAKQAAEDARAVAYDADGNRIIGILSQSVIDGLKDDLQLAIDNLELKDADYTEVEELILKYNNMDKSQLDTDSTAVVEDAIASVVYGLKANEQYKVDNYAFVISNAIDNLRYLPADYTQVDLAVSNAQKVDRTYYSTESIARLDTALATVKYGYGVNLQDEVDLMAQAINEALNSLEPGPADYTRVNSAIDKFNALNHSHYTETSVADVQNIINGINWELTKEDQDIVNGYAFDILDMMGYLVEAKADYTELRRMVAEDVPSDLSKYTTDTVKDLNYVLDSIDWELNAKDQDKVTEYQNKLKTAIDNLALLPGDYTDVDAAIEEGRALIASGEVDEKDAEAFEEYVASINRNYTLDEQAEIAKLASQIRAMYEKFSAAESVNKATITLEADKSVSYQGDIVTVSVIIGTDYYAAATSIPVLYDSNFFELAGTTVDEAFAFEGSFAAASVTGGNITSPDKGYPSSYADSDKEQWKYALVTIAPDSDLNSNAQILDPAQTVVKIQFRVKDIVALNGKIWVDDAFLKTDDNKTGKLFIGRYRTEEVNNDVVTVGQTIDVSAAQVLINVKDPNASADFTELMNAISRSSEIDSKSYYTTDSYEAYTNAYNVATEIYFNKSNYTVKEQNEVDAAADALNLAIDELQYLPATTTPLEEALALVPEYDQDMYTEETYSVYQTAVDAGNTLLAKEDLTIKDDADIQSAADDITAAFESLALKPFSYTTMMETELAKELDYDESFYTEDSLSNYQSAYDTLVEFKNSSPTILDDDDGFALIMALRSAYNTLVLKPVDTSPLVEAINTTLDYEADVYTEETYSFYQEAIDAGNAILAETDLSVADNERIQAAADDIYAAIELLEVKPFSYQELADEALGNWFYEGDDSEYTEKSVENFWNAYIELEAFIYSGEELNATHDAEALRLINNLKDALDNMEYVPADLTLLEEALALEVYSEEYYVEGTYDAYAAAKAELDAYGEDYYWTLAEQDTVDALAQAIIDAHAELVLKPFSYEAEMEEALSTEPEYEENFYTEDTYQAYSEAFDALAAFSENELTIIDDEDGLALINAVNEKRGALELKPVDTTPLEDAINTPLEYDVSLYTEETYAEYQAKIDAGNAILVEENLTVADNERIQAAANEILAAIENLALKPFNKLADLEAALTVTPEYPSNYYVTEIYAEYEAAKKVIEDMIASADTLTILDDVAADDAIVKYNEALETLKAETAFVEADYSDVEYAIDEAEALNKDIYTNYEIVEEAISNVVYGLIILEQETVNGYATAIREAITKLIPKPADYTVVEDAISASEARLEEMKAVGIDLDQTTVDALNEAIANVVYELDITKQEEVQGYADAIIAATEALDYVSTIVLKDESVAYITEEDYIRGLADIASEDEIASQFNVYGKNTIIVIVPTNNGYGTGTLVQHYDGEVLVKEYVIVVNGDADGSGFVDAEDVSIVAELINNFEEPATEYVMTAIDLENDGWLDAIDLTIIINMANMAY